MVFKNGWWRVSFLVAGILFLVAACSTSSPQEPEEVAPTATSVPQDSEEVVPTATSVSPGDELDSTLTPTPTPTPGSGGLSTPTSASSPCEGLSGEIEVQVLVGPAEAVGLEPVAVGSIPIGVVSEAAPYLVEGAGPISYEAVLEEVWGTYAVTLEMEIVVDGECGGTEGEEVLLLNLGMSGEQMVEVTAEGFHGEYPWSGEHEFEVEFPLEEGATVGGEGWEFVLHLDGR